MAMEGKHLHEAFVEELQDAYSAEKMIVDALPKMEQAASTNELKQAFRQHLDMTKKQVDRLEQVMNKMQVKPGNKTCQGMEGIIKEGQMIMQKDLPAEAKDAALIGAAQKVEHYEMALYGTLATWADFMDHKEAARMLKETLEEEKETDKKLTMIAEKHVNKEAMRR
jgi:ferritin-like metal-binding protein YciE